MERNGIWRQVLAGAVVFTMVLTGAIGFASGIVCEKPCGTKVEQCDVETVYRLTSLPSTVLVGYHDTDGNGRYNDDEGAYIDMDANGIVSEGDIRLSWVCGTFPPNSKVGPHDGDRSLTLMPFPGSPVVFMYIDLNGDGMMQMEEPIYLDTTNPGVVSVNDIRLTDSPAYDCYGVARGEWGHKWTRVKMSDGDWKLPLRPVPDTIPPGPAAGTPWGVLGYVDADGSGSWSCPDKLYMKQAHGDPQHDDFVTIGDLRLYIPPGDECVPECGEKVEECSEDAVYALVRSNDVGGGLWQWGFYDVNFNGVFDTNETAYIDMDANGVVSAGDVRLSGYCTTYGPNTKVKPHDVDLDKPLTIPAQAGAFAYTDLNQNGVFDLYDPVYLDTDGNGMVSIGDIRITDAPPFDVQGLKKGEFGPAWSVVKAGDKEVMGGVQIWLLFPLPPVVGVPGPAGSPRNVLGYIDADCSLSWTCPDKLYIQQAHRSQGGTGIHDAFVTIGDIRLYVPPEDRCWEPCGTKVVQCDIDATYCLEQISTVQWAYHDTGSKGVFDSEDGGYLDMDGSGTVTAGDIRLTWVCGKYPPNTKVGIHDDDLNEPLVVPSAQAVFCYWDINQNGVFDLQDPVYVDTDTNGIVSKDDIRITASPPYDVQNIPAGFYGANWTLVRVGDGDMKEPLTLIRTGVPANELRYVDADCSISWTCPDKLYLYLQYPRVVTIGDVRIYIPSSGAGGTTPDVCDRYDTNGNGKVDMNEVMQAVCDWKQGYLGMADLMKVILCWKTTA